MNNPKPLKTMITYNTDGTRMPKIKKRDTSAWIKAVAQSYGKKVGDIAEATIPNGKIKLEIVSITA